jgi:anti-sigma factor RsiW
MNCRRVVELLIDYVSGELPENERGVLEQHFDRCPPCLVYMQTYETTIRMTRQLPLDAPLPPELEQRLLAVIRALDSAGREDNPAAADRS